MLALLTAYRVSPRRQTRLMADVRLCELGALQELQRIKAESK